MKTIISLKIYDETIEASVEEKDIARYQEAADYISKKYNSYMQVYENKRSDHTIALMTLLDVVINPMSEQANSKV